MVSGIKPSVGLAKHEPKLLNYLRAFDRNILQKRTDVLAHPNSVVLYLKSIKWQRNESLFANSRMQFEGTQHFPRTKASHIHFQAGFPEALKPLFISSRVQKVVDE